uniref:CSON006720 protein n=1 Tax=Culicoides sonorensis TaxID=179676 RepID=A0A336N584_CULSO
MENNSNNNYQKNIILQNDPNLNITAQLISDSINANGMDFSSSHYCFDQFSQGQQINNNTYTTSVEQSANTYVNFNPQECSFENLNTYASNSLSYQSNGNPFFEANLIGSEAFANPQSIQTNNNPFRTTSSNQNGVCQSNNPFQFDTFDINLDELDQNTVNPDALNEILSEFESSSNQSSEQSPRHVELSSSPETSELATSSNSDESSRHSVQLLGIHQTNLLESNEFVDIINKIKNLISEFKSINQLRDELNMTYRVEKYVNNYNLILENLVEFDQRLQKVYDEMMNEYLIQSNDISLKDQNFALFKSNLNIILKNAISMLDIYFEVGDKSTMKKLRGLIENILVKAFIIVKQPDQIFITTKTISATVELICYPTIDIKQIFPVEVKLYSERALRNELNQRKRRIDPKNVSSENDSVEDLKVFSLIRHSNKKTEKTTDEYSISFALDRETQGFVGEFEKMKIDNFARKRSHNPICDDKYCLVFKTAIQFPKHKNIEIFTYSKPILIITNNSQENAALESIVWDTACASIDRIPFKTSPKTIKWRLLKSALSEMFHKMVGRKLSDENLKFIFDKILTNSKTPRRPDLMMDDYEIDRKTQLNRTLSNCKIEINPDEANNGNENKKAVTLFGWIAILMQTCNCFFRTEWKEGLIHGFLEKKEAERIVIKEQPGTFIIRFSESLLGALTIVYCMEKDNRKMIDHILVKGSELKATKFQAMINRIPKIERVLCLNGEIKSKQDAFIYNMVPIQPDGYHVLQWNPILQD